MPYIDWKKLKQRVSLREILTHYGLLDGLTETAQGYEGECPFCGSNAFKGNAAKNAWFCFGDCKAEAQGNEGKSGGNILDFVALREGSDLKKAATLIAGWFPDEGQPTKKASPKKGQQAKAGQGAQKRAKPKEPAPPAEPEVKTEQSKEAPEPDEGQGGEHLLGRRNQPLDFLLKSIDYEHPALDALGFSRETLKAFDVGYFTGKGMMHDKLVLPFHDRDGRLVAYVGYSPKDGSFTYPDRKRFDRRLELYNVVCAESTGLYQDGIVLVTNLLNVLRFYEVGVKRVLALPTDAVYAPQLEEIRRLVGTGGNVDFVPWTKECGATLRALSECFHVRLHRYYRGAEDEFLAQVVESLNEW